MRQNALASLSVHAMSVVGKIMAVRDASLCLTLYTVGRNPMRAEKLSVGGVSNN
jgi:hypothetical protein